MAYQRLSSEEKERRKKELLDKVENIIDNFQRSPADLIEYFKFNSKFYQYSKNNNTLIYQQNRYAQYCGSFKAFKDMGYSVKKGEHGMKILVPYISKYFYNADAQEWEKVSEATPEQKLKIKNGEIEIKQYTSFGVGTVFDISQTDCPVEDYPKFFGFGHTSKSHRELFNAVKYYAEGKGIPVEIIDLKSITLSGEYNAADNSIVLSDKLNDDRLLSVMTHELSHALLHNSDITENESKHIMQIEFEADAMSLLLRERLGISDIEDARQAHLQTSFKKYMEWAEANESEQHCPTLSEMLDNINDAYSKMVEDFDNSISHYFELHPNIEKSVNNFSQAIDDFLEGKINSSDHIFVCPTTEVMKVCGADDLDVMIYQNTIRKILSNDFIKFEHPHNLSPEDLKQLPTQLQNPIMVFKGSHQGSIVLVTDLFNNNSEQIIISCELDSGSEWNKINRITSMYGKENIGNYLNTQIKKDNLIGCQKNIANQMLHSVGLCLPSENTFIDYTDIIPNFDKNVNKKIFEKSLDPYNLDLDELEKLYNISLKLNEKNLHPVDILKDTKQIDFYSFACNINDSELTKNLLWKLQQNDIQIVALTPSENGYILNCIGKDFTVQPFKDTVYITEEAALSEVFSNGQIAKLVDLKIIESCRVYKDLSVLSEADNLKYPYIQIHWTDSEQMKNCECISLKAAQEKFNQANDNAAGDSAQSTSFSLHLSDDIIYNLKYNHSVQGQEIIEFIKSHLQEIQSDQSLNKTLTALNSYINSQIAYQEQLNHQSNQALDSFDATEYPL